jgi:hypothetical protein
MTDTSDTEGCGEGCVFVTAFETSIWDSYWYDCNMTMSDTQNATLPEHKMGAPLKTLAGQGIALQGRVQDAKQNASGVQFQSYPSSSLYGTPREGYSDMMGLTIGIFATGVIAVAGSSNPPLLVLGPVPELGSQLQVRWKFVSIIFGLTVFIQFALFVVIAVVSNLVIVKDESPFSTARLLRPIIDRVGASGTYADGKQIIKMLENGPMDKVVYSVKHPQDGTIHHLDLGHQKRLRAFPRGDYD